MGESIGDARSRRCSPTTTRASPPGTSPIIMGRPRILSASSAASLASAVASRGLRKFRRSPNGYRVRVRCRGKSLTPRLPYPFRAWASARSTYSSSIGGTIPTIAISTRSSTSLFFSMRAGFAISLSPTSTPSVCASSLRMASASSRIRCSIPSWIDGRKSRWRPSATITELPC